MELRKSLVSYTLDVDYRAYPFSISQKEAYAKSFLRALNSNTLDDILKVGINDMRINIVNSSRTLCTLDTLEQEINDYALFKLGHNKYMRYQDKVNEYESPDFCLTLFFMYLYFVSPSRKLSTQMFRQGILDIMAAYSINEKYNRMLDFIYCAVVCEKQLRYGTRMLKCSQYEELDNIIKAFEHTRSEVISKYEANNVNEVYIESYTDCFSEAKDFGIALQSAYENLNKQ